MPVSSTSSSLSEEDDIDLQSTPGSPDKEEDGLEVKVVAGHQSLRILQALRMEGGRRVSGGEYQWGDQVTVISVVQLEVTCHLQCWTALGVSLSQGQNQPPYLSSQPYFGLSAPSVQLHLYPARMRRGKVIGCVVVVIVVDTKIAKSGDVHT